MVNIVCVSHDLVILLNGFHIQPKTALFALHQEDWLENNIYQEMALTASSFAYTWSKWNADCGKDKIIIQAIEQLQDEQPLEVIAVIKTRSLDNGALEF